MVVPLCDYTKTYQIVYVKVVKFIVYELYPNKAVIKQMRNTASSLTKVTHHLPERYKPK